MKNLSAPFQTFFFYQVQNVCLSLYSWLSLMLLMKKYKSCRFTRVATNGRMSEENCWEARYLLDSRLTPSPGPRNQPRGARHANPCRDTLKVTGFHEPLGLLANNRTTNIKSVKVTTLPHVFLTNWKEWFRVLAKSTGFQVLQKLGFGIQALIS